MIPDPEISSDIHKTGHPLADKAVAFSALFVSLCSLGIALHHGRTMQRLVEANSRPFVQFSLGNDSQTGDVASRDLTLSITNPGAGAARVEKFSVLIDGKVAPSIGDALMQLAGFDSGASLSTETQTLGAMTVADIAPSYVKAGSDQVLLRWPRTEKNAAIWDRISSAGDKHVTFEACYCSIFDECWIENSYTFRPTPVKTCT